VSSPVQDRPVADALMRLAIDQARLAHAAGDVPIGCVIWHDPSARVLASGFNEREATEDPTAHAEVVAIRRAAQALGTWRLLDCTLVVTLEPCCMCAGAIVNARVPRLIYGCPDPKAGAVRTLHRLCDDERLNHRVDVTSDVLSEECAELLRAFFREQRALGKK
jgi:tRNA(adenine34) deaminase